jgi:peptidoglycan/xylan/chitin deacetylase (PgdA/CDA1 family)
MPPKRDLVPRVRSAPQWLGGLFVLGLIGAAVIGGGALLWENVDVQRMTTSAALREPHTAPPSLMSDTPGHADTPIAATLYFSQASSEFFPEADYYPNLLDGWEQLVSAAGARVARISSVDDINSLTVEQVLIAPSAVCLSNSEVSAMRAFAERGGGLVLSWAAGARDSTCEWVGWDALNELTEIPDFNTLEQREAVYLTVPSGLPLSVGFGPATRIELSYESQLAMATRGARLYWSDWALNAEPVEEVVGMDAAAWLGRTDGGGRVVWFGFRLGHGASERDEEHIARIFRNGVWWAGGVPVVEIAPWPNGSQSAFMLTQDVESHFANSLNLARVAKEKAVPATFFVVSQLASEFPEIADSLMEAGEVGSHSSDHTVVADRAYVDQRSRLSRSQAELRGWAGDPVSGLRPPEERFDEATLRAWTWNGGSYIVGVNEARTGSPEVFDTPDGKIVMLPRIIKNDYNVFVQDGAIRSRRLTEAYLAGMAKINALGALAIVSLRTQVAGENSRIQLVADVIDSARAQGDWWFASGHEMANWWLSRWESSVGVNDMGEGRLQVSVTADDELGLDGAWLEVFLPGLPEDWIPRQSGALIRHVRTEWGVRIPLVDIAPGEESLLDLTYLEPQLSTESQNH